MIDPVLCTECVGHYDTPTCQKFAQLQTALSQIPNTKKVKSSFGERFVMIHHSDKL